MLSPWCWVANGLILLCWWWFPQLRGIIAGLLGSAIWVLVALSYGYYDLLAIEAAAGVLKARLVWRAIFGRVRHVTMVRGPFPPQDAIGR